MRRFNQLPLLRRQAGASLVIGLIILTLLTVLGLVSTSGHLLQQKALVAGMDREHALRAAERALEWGEALLQNTIPVACMDNCTAYTPVWHSQAMPDALENMDASWWQQHGIEFGHDPLQQAASLAWPEATPPPRLIIEELVKQEHPGASGEKFELRYYRVYANGYSVNEDNHVIVASTISVPYMLESPGQDSAQSIAVPCSQAELGDAGNTDNDQANIRCGRLGWREIL